MTIQDLETNIIDVDLSKEPDASDELARLIDSLADRPACHVIIDFSNVDILRSPTIRALIQLHQLLKASGRKLLLHSIANLTKGIFDTTRISAVFAIVQDRDAALQQLNPNP
jgi:anti-anti-sigma factor